MYWLTYLHQYSTIIVQIFVLIGLYFLKCTKFDQLILRKIIKIVATRCQILTLKCTKIDFGWGSAPNPWGSLQRSPRPPSWIQGRLLLRGGKGRGQQGREREGREGKGRSTCLPPRFEGREREGREEEREGGRERGEEGKGKGGRKGKGGERDLAP